MPFTPPLHLGFVRGEQALLLEQLKLSIQIIGNSKLRKRLKEAQVLQRDAHEPISYGHDEFILRTNSLGRAIPLSWKSRQALRIISERGLFKFA
jgi:hypothetical protein